MPRCLLSLFCAAVLASAADKPVFEREDINPLDVKHNHASSIVELPNGDLLAAWYRGSGERTADDVVVLGARKKKGAKQWSAPFLLADMPGFPDTNPALFVDSKQHLWLIWQTIIANEWHTALTTYRITSDWGGDGAPRWQLSEPLLFVPHNFAAKVKEVVTPLLNADGRTGQWAKRTLEHGNDKYFSRMGWMTRAHPVELPGGRIIVPLYSDGYSFSLMAITDDYGKTCRRSEALVGGGNIPTLHRAAQRRNAGHLHTR
ncbi:MAG: sialidase family protein [Bryobacteraceae bacterium]